MDHGGETKGVLVRGAVGAALICVALLGGAGLSAVAEEETEVAEQIEALLDESRALMKHHLPQQAIPLLKKADKLDKAPCYECRLLESQAYLQLRKRKDAIKTATRVVKGDGPVEVKVKAHNLLALALQRNGECKPDECQQAEAEYREAIRLSEGDDLAIRFNLGIFLLRIDRQEEGLTVLREVMEDGIDEKTSRWIRLILAEPDCADGTCAPEYAVTTLDGRYFSRDDLKGKAVLLYFLTPDTLSPYSLPTLDSLSKRVAEEPFALFALSFVDERTLREFGQEHEVNFPLCQDGLGNVASMFGVQMYPTAVVIDHRGHIVWRAVVNIREAHAHLDAAVGDAIKKARKAAEEQGGGER